MCADGSKPTSPRLDLDIRQPEPPGRAAPRARADHDEGDSAHSICFQPSGAMYTCHQKSRCWYAAQRGSPISPLARRMRGALGASPTGSSGFPAVRAYRDCRRGSKDACGNPNAGRGRGAGCCCFTSHESPWSGPVRARTASEWPSPRWSLGAGRLEAVGSYLGCCVLPSSRQSVMRRWLGRPRFATSDGVAVLALLSGAELLIPAMERTYRRDWGGGWALACGGSWSWVVTRGRCVRRRRGRRCGRCIR